AGTSPLDQLFTVPLLLIELYLLCIKVPKQITTMAAISALRGGGGGGGGHIRLPSSYNAIRTTERVEKTVQASQMNTLQVRSPYLPGGAAATSASTGTAATVLAGIATAPAGGVGAAVAGTGAAAAGAGAAAAGANAAAAAP